MRSPCVWFRNVQRGSEVLALGTEKIRVKGTFEMSEWKEQLTRTRGRWKLDLKGIICGVVD